MIKVAAATLVVVAGALAYSPIFFNEFAWDDTYLVTQNSAITDVSQIPSLFIKPWASDVDYDLGQAQNRPYFRPMALASMAVDYAIAGPNPTFFHATNLVLHLVTALLLFIWLMDLFDTRRAGQHQEDDGTRLAIATVLATIWAIHPVSAEAVALVSYRTSLLSGLSVVGLLALSSPRRDGNLGLARTISAVALFAIGLLSKETTLVAPGLVFLQDIYFGRLNRRRLFTFYAPLALVAAFWWVARLNITGPGVYTWFEGLSIFQGILMIPRIFFLYVRLGILPHPLCPFYDWSIIGVPNSPLEPDILAGTALLTAMLVGIVVLRRRAPGISFGLAFFGLALLPVSHIIPFFDAAGDRFMYVPVIGLIVAVGVALSSPQMRRIALALAVVVPLVFGGLTVRRTIQWHDDESILQATVTDFPTSISANLGLGRLLLAKQRPSEAIAQFKTITTLAPNLAVGHALLAVSLARSGDPAGAQRVLRRSPMPERGLPSAVEIARNELGKAKEFKLLHQIGLLDHAPGM